MDLLSKFELDQRRRGLSENSIDYRSGQIKRYESTTGQSLVDASPEEIQVWLDTRTKRNGEAISDKTRACYLTTFSAFFKWGIKKDEITFNPIEKLDRPKTPAGIPNPIPEPDLKRAMAQAKPMMRCWLALEAYGGLRCQEVAYLEHADIRYDIGKVMVRHGKGGKERAVALHDAIRDALALYEAPTPSGRLWPDVTPSSVSQRINRYLHGMGIAHTAHKNRHRYATRLLKSSGGNFGVVKRALGHASIATSQIYAAIEDEEVQTAAMAI